jgi:hypothetical protein
MSTHSLMPDNATPFEEVFSRAIDTYERLDPVISSLHGLKLMNPPASFLPYLVYEYGLGELSPYVPNLYDLIREGIAWQRVRGTPLAMEKALGWLSYTAVIEEAPVRREYWNAFSLELDRVRDDEADLLGINGVANLSTPMRSDLWRGFHGYDIRAAEAGFSQAGAVFVGNDSGVRIPGAAAKWSFGRSYEHVHDITPDDLDALGIEDAWAITLDGEPLTLDGEALRFVPGGGAAEWADGPWLDIPWLSDEVYAASVAALAATGSGPAWAVFKDSAGDVLFCRRCRIRRSVVPAPNGVYALNGSRYQPAVGTDLYLEALTGFGDGYGGVAHSVGFILSASPAAGHKPGADYLPAGAIEPSGPTVAEFSIHIEFGRTVRERVACLLRF